MMIKLSIFIVLLCVSINYNGTSRYFYSSSPQQQESYPWIFEGVLLDSEAFEDGEAPDNNNNNRSMEYDFYREICPDAEKIIRAKVHQLFKINPAVAPALLRLAFHDCFIQGCDASLLLDAVEGMDSEKYSPPNDSLKGFDVIDMIKSELEQVCPAVVSCADILVLAGREAVLLVGETAKPLSLIVPQTTFLHPMLIYLKPLLPFHQGMAMTYEGTGAGFGTVYYHSLLQGRGILYADQQLIVGEETGV
ncbi:hypothetical protein PTKIN_Ptkin13bG0121600 [Pterospermum kingtungense]